MSKSIVRIVFAVLISVGAIAMAASTSVQAKVKTILQKIKPLEKPAGVIAISSNMNLVQAKAMIAALIRHQITKP